jgi:hypothetical protein
MAQRGQKSSKREAEAGKRNLEAWLKANPSRGNLRHGVYSRVIHNRYADRRTREGKTLQAILDAILEDIGPELDARQSLLMSLIRSKVIVIMCIGKYLESVEEIVDYEQGTVPHVVDKTFFYASASLRSALGELYATGNGKNRGKKTYEEIVSEMNKAEAATRAPSSDPEEEGPPFDSHKS